MTVEWKAGAHALSVVLGLAMVVMGCGGGSGGDPDAGTAADEGVSPDQGMVVEDGGPTDACAAQEDLPDEDNVDSNCDGIDGDAEDAVFVTTTGSLVESSTVGTRAMPAGSIAFGISLAQVRGKSQVLVAAGDYPGAVTLVEGVGVFGGYSVAADWARTAVIDTHIAGSVLATDIEARTLLSQLTVTAPDATTPGGSSIAMRVIRSSGLEVSDSTFTAGAGMPGVGVTTTLPVAPAGSFGDNFAATQRVAALQTSSGGSVLSNPEIAGGTKQNHAMPNAFDCSGLASCGQVPFVQPHLRSPGGANTCGCGRGGEGGAGLVNPAPLTLAAFQDIIGSFQAGRGGAGALGEVPGTTCAAQVQNGGGAAGYWNVGRVAVANLSLNDIGPRPTGPIQGSTGAAGADGAAGPQGAAGAAGSFDATGYVPSAAGAGGTGVGGAGGAGGGGGAAFMCADEGVHNGTPNNYDELWIVMTGGAGGGGGAGGCAGTGGAPGSGGGASIAIFVWESTPTFVRVTAVGGAGGQGGAGQAGQVGGNGGNGVAGRGPFNDDLGFGDTWPSWTAWENGNAERWCVGGTSGGQGGRGGKGGDGGGGGGGAGGDSIGIVLAGGSSTSASSSDLTTTGGTGGAAGDGAGTANDGAAGQSLGMFSAP
ncbi:MAG: hypothetical protein IPI43_27000 [Sandaracinaceae bacterium]|nr:hypothetical protein [Sandaracinaceae bacterium]